MKICKHEILYCTHYCTIGMVLFAFWRLNWMNRYCTLDTILHTMKEMNATESKQKCNYIKCKHILSKRTLKYTRGINLCSPIKKVPSNWCVSQLYVCVYAGNVQFPCDAGVTTVLESIGLRFEGKLKIQSRCKVHRKDLAWHCLYLVYHLFSFNIL